MDLLLFPKSTNTFDEVVRNFYYCSQKVTWIYEKLLFLFPKVTFALWIYGTNVLMKLCETSILVPKSDFFMKSYFTLWIYGALVLMKL